MDDTAWRAGERIDRFELRQPLGAGAMGTVWAAFDPELSREVAIKILHPRQPAPGADAPVDDDRLRREAQAMARLRHPNVVTVYEVGTARGVRFVVMERVDGPTLRVWLGERRRSIAAVLAVFEAAGRGLDAAHAAGLVHRDFKPDNVLVDARGVARVVDFGLARDSGEAITPPRPPDVAAAVTGTASTAPQFGAGAPAFTASTRSVAVAGTLPYMAPELLRGEPATPLSDQYAFCVALYEAIYGE